MERPKFGYAVKIMLKENEPCDLNLENPDQSTCILQSNRTSGSITENLNHYAQSRQSGEEFRSAAPSDCRIFVCGSPTPESSQPTQPATDNDGDYAYEDDDDIRKVNRLV